jgi:hypothetical protein
MHPSPNDVLVSHRTSRARRTPYFLGETPRPPRLASLQPRLSSFVFSPRDVASELLKIAFSIIRNLYNNKVIRF